jgi:iron(III) transport system substrate-binding protein
MEQEESSMAITRRSFVALSAAALATRPALAIEPSLIEAAKAEGQLTWYTGLIVRQVVTPLKEAFEAKYGIPVSFVPVAAQESALRILNEGRAGAIQADVFDGAAPYLAAREANLILPYKPAEAGSYADSLKDPDGNWTAQLIQVTSPAINTSMVTPEEAPKTFADLLDPRWTGQMAWSNSEEVAGPPGFIGNVLMTMGEEKGMDYLKQLAGQKLANVPSNMRVVLDQCIAGQYPLVLSILNYHAAISAGQGAPVEWLKLETSMLTFGTVQLLKGSPHPNAGKLFAEFMLSEEGQQVVKAAGYIPAHPNVAAPAEDLKPEGGGFKVNVISPDLFQQNRKKWVDIYHQLFT